MRQKSFRALPIIFGVVLALLGGSNALEAQATDDCRQAPDNPIGLYQDCKDVSWGIGNITLRTENRYKQFLGGQNTLLVYLRTNPDLQSQEETFQMFMNVRRFGVEKFADDYRAVQGLDKTDPARTFLFFEPDRTVNDPVLSIYVGEHWDSISTENIVLDGDEFIQHQVGKALRSTIRTWRNKNRIDFIAEQLPDRLSNLSDIPVLFLTPTSPCTNDETKAFGHVKQCKYLNLMMGDEQLFENDRYAEVFSERDFVVLYLRSKNSALLADVLAASIALDPVVRSEQKVPENGYSRIVVFHQNQGSFTEPDLSVYLGGYWDIVSQEKIPLTGQDVYAVTRSKVYGLFKDRMIAKLKAQIEADKKALAGIDDELDNLNREREETKQNLARLQQERGEIINRLNLLKDQRLVLQKNLEQARQQRQFLLAEIERVTQEIARLQTVIAKAKERERLQEELKVLLAQREKVDQQTRQLQREKQSMENELADLNSYSARLSQQLCSQGRTSHCQ